MTATFTDGSGRCVWCDQALIDRDMFPACSETCRAEAAAYRERQLRRWRLFS